MTEERRMNGVEFLTQVRKAKERERKLQTRAEQLEALATDTAYHMNGLPIGTGQPDADRTGTMSAAMCDAKAELEEVRETLRRVQEEVTQMILQVEDPDAQTVLLLQYIKGMKYEEIAATMHFSVGWVYQRRRNGIREIEEMIGRG